MTRLERLSAILIRLQSRRVVSAPELAERFGVSLRTVYRDIRSLEEAGVPVGAEAGRGYFLAGDYTVPPVAFTPDEAGALITAGKLLSPLADESVRQLYDSAVGKVMAVISRPLRDSMEALENRVEVYAGPAVLPQAPILADIQAAIRGNRVLGIRYAAAGGEAVSRDVEPLILLFYDMKWFLYAWCRLRRAYRSFRVDRIAALAARGEAFDAAAHAGALKRAKGALVAGRPARRAPAQRITR